MSRISQTAEYALRAVVYLAQHGGAPRSGDVIADATDVPRNYLTKVLQELAKVDLIVVSRGPGGGYSITRDPARISVLEVVSTVDPSWRIQQCPLGNPHHVKLCPLHRKLDQIAALAETAMRTTSIAELMPTTAVADRCSFPGIPGEKPRSR